MRILIIGGTGNISGPVAEYLQARGDDVTVTTSGRNTVPDGYRKIVTDRFDRRAFVASLKDVAVDAVINFLGFRPGDCELDREVFGGKIAQYVFISSATVYRKPHTRLPLVEGMPRGNNFSEYARNKIACEEYLATVHGADFPVTVVRPSHTFGKTWIPSPLNGSDYTVAARIVAGRPIVLHDDGQSLWTLTAATDFAAGLAGLVGNLAAVGETFHITHDQALTWNTIYWEIGRALGREPEIVRIPSEFICAAYPPAAEKLFGDKAEHGVFDNGKIKRFVPDFECRKTFRAALGESIAWFNADPARKKIDPEQDRLIDGIISRWRENGQ